MPAETDVINFALRLIGADPIASLDDGSHNANVARSFYTEIRDQMLRGHPWNFATKREKLAQSSTVPAFEHDHAYPMPSDWLRTISIHDNDAGFSTMLYSVEEIDGKTAVVTSADHVYLRYVAKVTDVNRMPPDFRKALEYRLAAAMAVPLAGSNTLRAECTKMGDRAMAQARSSDAMGGFPERRPRGSWASSRGTGQFRIVAVRD